MNDSSPTAYDNTVLVLARKKDETLEFLFLKERGVLKRRLDKRNKREELEGWFLNADEASARKGLRKLEEFYRILSLSIPKGGNPQFSVEQLQQITDLA